MYIEGEELPFLVHNMQTYIHTHIYTKIIIVRQLSFGCSGESAENSSIVS